jgi:hypothetical protein
MYELAPWLFRSTYARVFFALVVAVLAFLTGFALAA